MLAFFLYALLFMKIKTSFAVLLSISVLCLYPWQELGTPGGLGFIRNNIGWIVIIAASFLLSLDLFTQKHYSIPQFWIVGLLGCLIACLPLLIGSRQFIENSLWLPLGLVLSWLFLLCVINNRLFIKHKKILLFWVIIICSFQVVIAILQLFHGLMMETTSGVIAYKIPWINGTFNQRNVYASFVVTGLVSALYIFPVKRSYKIGKTTFSAIQQNHLLLVFLFLGGFTVILTESRAGIYSLMGCLLLFVVGCRQSFREKLLKPTGVLIIAVILSQITINTIYDSKTKEFSRTTNRQVIYYTSIEAIKDAPVFGHGLGSFEKVYLEKLSVLASVDKLKPAYLEGRSENLSHPHNELLYWGVQGGLVSILGLLIIVFSVLSLFRHTDLNKALTYIALLFPISFHLMVELPFYISTVHLIVFVLLIAYVVTSIGNFKTYNISMMHNSIFGGITGIIAGVLVVALSLNTYSLFKGVKFERALNPNLADLDKVVLTLGWDDTYQSLRLRHEANRAARQGVIEPQVEYLKWLEQQIEISPRMNYYFNLYVVNKHLGHSSKAQFYYHEIKRLFSGISEAEAWIKAHTSKGS